MLTTIERRYAPRGAARALLESRRGEVVLSGPAGTGKSRAGLEKIHMAMLKYPGARALLVRKTQTSLSSTGIITWEQQVVAEALRHGLMSRYGGGSMEPPGYRYSNGSRVVVGGMDKAEKIMSSEYDLAYVQEATELAVGDWEAITSRLRYGKMPYQQLIADCNPAQPTHWLKQRAQAGATLMLESRHEDNPRLFGDDGQVTEQGADYLARLDALTGVRHKRLRLGLWVAAEGLVYEEFDPHVHVLPPEFGIPETWARYWTVDFGFRHALVWQCWAEDGDGRLYLYRELYRRGLLVEDAARLMLDEVAPVQKSGERRWREPRPTGVYCDHDAEDRATLERHLGFGTTAAHKSVSDGIQAVAVRLRVQADGKPRIYFIADCQLGGRQDVMVESGQPAATVEEFPGYVWDTGGGKRILEQPVKVFDDGLDSCRYMVAARDLQGTPGVRWLE